MLRICCALLLGLASSFAYAQDNYPARPIRIINTVAPGGGADFTTRAVGNKLAEAWGQQVIVDNWYGFLAPRGAPRPVIVKLHREINRILELPDVTERLQGLGIFSFLAPTPEAFGDYIKAEIRKYAKVVQDSGVRVD